MDHAPQWGGFYERMNSLIKNSLRKSLRNARLSYEEFETIVIEIEAVINSRPLTYVYDEDLLEPLTPSHLMYGRRLNSDVNLETENLGEVPPTKRVKYVKRLIDGFKKRFSNEYLTNLRERDKLTGKDLVVREGDVVLVKEKFLSRAAWKLGKIVRVIRSADRLPKGAELKTADGLIKRPLSSLCALEIGDNSTEHISAPVTEPSTEHKADSVIELPADPPSETDTAPAIPPPTCPDVPKRARRTAAKQVNFYVD